MPMEIDHLCVWLSVVTLYALPMTGFGAAVPIVVRERSGSYRCEWLRNMLDSRWATEQMRELRLGLGLGLG